VVARTDATEESEILRRAEMLAATDADVLLVDGVRSVEWIRKVRGVVGNKPLLFNQIAGGLSPRLSLSELEELGINVAIYSTPCLFAAHTAMANALTELRANDGRLADVTTDDVGVASSIALLERNLSRHHLRPRLDWGSEMRPAG
jgi:2-methylisocitrate lyase-like PEP mutase family enzyme